MVSCGGLGVYYATVCFLVAAVHCSFFAVCICVDAVANFEKLCAAVSAFRTVPAPYVPPSVSVSEASNFVQDADYDMPEVDDTPPSIADQQLFAEFSTGETTAQEPAQSHAEEDRELPDDL